MTSIGRNALLGEGRYRLLDRLADGGQSTVWLAEDLQCNAMRVAIKFFLPGMGMTRHGLDLVAREFQITRELHDTRLLVPYHYFVEGASPCMVARYVSGGSLYQKLNREGLLSEQEIARIVYQTASALDYLHNHGQGAVLHMDIKPENILIDENGNYLLSDFGISIKLRNTLSYDNASKGGTITHSAPEVIEGKSPLPASDLFALGIVMYECCHGLLGEHCLIGHQVAAGGKPTLDLPPGRYTQRFQEIIQLLWHRDPSCRPTAAQLAAWARSYIQHGYWPTLEKNCGKTPPKPTIEMKKILVASAAVFFLALAGWYFFTGRMCGGDEALELHQKEMQKYIDDANAIKSDIPQDSILLTSSVGRVINNASGFYNDLNMPQKARTLLEQDMQVLKNFMCRHKNQYCSPQ